MAGQGDTAGGRRVGQPWVTDPSPSQMPGPLVLTLLMEGQQRPRLLPFPGRTKAEPEALWLETKIDFSEEGDRLGGGLPRSGKLRGPGLGMGESLDQEGQGLPQPSRSAKGLGRQFWWEGGRFPGGRGSRAAVGAVGPAAMRQGEGQGQSRSGRTRGAPPADPCSGGRVCGGTGTARWPQCYWPLGMKGSPSPGSGWGPGSLRQRCILWELGLSLDAGVKTSSVPGDESSLVRIMMPLSSSWSSLATLPGSRFSPKTLPFSSSFTRSTDSGDCGEAGSMVITGKSAFGS